jgi:hypothetical protein
MRLRSAHRRPKAFSDVAPLPGDVSPELAPTEEWVAASEEFIVPPVSATVVWSCGGASETTINSVFIYHTKSHPCLQSRIPRPSLAYL